METKRDLSTVKSVTVCLKEIDEDGQKTGKRMCMEMTGAQYEIFEKHVKTVPSNEKKEVVE
ncbi:MAG: hypothetical protein NTZ10_03305 [Candidatus Saganbacteria bacterium]|nr:hypothetical protein [Candidatus Saganbacteria bacterium]